VLPHDPHDVAPERDGILPDAEIAKA